MLIYAMQHLTVEAYDQLSAIATRLADGMQAAFDAAGVAAVVPRIGPLVGLFFGATAPTDFDSAKVICDNGVYAKFFHGMLDRGITLAPGAYEAIFPSLAHADAEIEETLVAVAEVAASL